MELDELVAKTWIGSGVARSKMSSVAPARIDPLIHRKLLQRTQLILVGVISTQINLNWHRVTVLASRSAHLAFRSQSEFRASLTCSSMGLCQVLERDVMGSEFGSYTEWLIEEVRCYADSRDRDAESCPEDRQILRSSNALRSLADQMSGLPVDHPKILQLWQLWFGPTLQSKTTDQIKSLDLVTIVSNELEHYGYDRAEVGNPEPFLDSLLSDLEQLLGNEEPGSQCPSSADQGLSRHGKDRGASTSN